MGLLGGSFNPAHGGHLALSRRALALLGLDEVWWLVSPQNPHKPRAGMAPLAERVAAAGALARHPRILPTDLERRLGTVRTHAVLARLRRRLPGTRFVWLAGADLLREMHRWERWRRVFRLAPVAVFARGPYARAALQSVAARRYARNRVSGPAVRTLPRRRPPAWAFVAARPHPASASALRARRRG